jgi:hypothetical protein
VRRYYGGTTSRSAGGDEEVGEEEAGEEEVEEESFKL